jgi:hypothetical protein
LPAYLKWRLHDCSDQGHLSLAQESSLLTSSLYKSDPELAYVDMRWSVAIVEELFKAGANPNFLDKKSNITPRAAFSLSALRLSKLKRDGSID